METLRCGTFETNSSSTHCMTIVDKEVFDKFEAGLYYWDYNKEDIVSTDTMFKEYLTWETNASERDRLSKPMSVDQFVRCLELTHEGSTPYEDEMKFRLKEFEAYIKHSDYASLKDLERDYEWESCSKTVGDKTVVAFAKYGWC